MNISNNTQSIHNEAAQDVRLQSGGKKTKAEFNIFDISNHHDKIVSKSLDFRNEFHFEGGDDEDLKALRGNLLEMDSLHLAKKRHVTNVDKTLLESDDCESDVDDFEEDGEWMDTYEVPLKRLSSGKGRLQIHRIVEEDKAEGFRKRVKDTLGVDSLHINRERLEE